jgi:hypothetical protein
MDLDLVGQRLEDPPAERVGGHRGVGLCRLHLGENLDALGPHLEGALEHGPGRGDVDEGRAGLVDGHPQVGDRVEVEVGACCEVGGDSADRRDQRGTRRGPDLHGRHPVERLVEVAGFGHADGSPF